MAEARELAVHIAIDGNLPLVATNPAVSTVLERLAKDWQDRAGLLL